MGRFLNNPTIMPFKAADTGKWTWVAVEPLRWECGLPGSGWIIEVRQDFTSDLGSIPWWARSLFNPADPQAVRSYLLHDFINSITYAALPDWNAGMSSQFAASQLYEALAFDGIPAWSRKLHFAAVLAALRPEEW